MGDVVNFIGDTTLDVSCSSVVDSIPCDLDQILVLGLRGDEDFLFMSTGDRGKNLLLLEIAKMRVLEPDDPK